MRMRWRAILCLWGLILFAFLTYGSIQVNRDMRQRQHGRYFWWGSVRLDSDPLNKRPKLKPCVTELEQDCGWDPPYIWITPGLIERTLIISALPAFLLTIATVRGLGRLGVNELVSFMVIMPVLVVSWFYTIGWVLDRWRYKRHSRQASALS